MSINKVATLSSKNRISYLLDPLCIRNVLNPFLVTLNKTNNGAPLFVASISALGGVYSQAFQCQVRLGSVIVLQC